MVEKKKRDLKVPFGKRADRLFSPNDDLAIGLDCNCACPGCGAELVLRRGKNRRHFAHHNSPAFENCVSQAIHSAAIQVLVEAKHVTIPANWIHIRRYANNGKLVERYLELCPKRRVRFDECRAEVTVSHPELGTVRPDVVGYRGDRQLFVEMWYTHQVDEEKKAKLEAIGVPAIEIWLQDLDMDEGFAAIERRVLSEPSCHWLFYPGEKEARARLQGEVDREVERINQLDAKRREMTRRKTEARQAQRAAIQQKKLGAERLRVTGESKKFLEFRQRPNEEKERTLRAALGIKGNWPRYLEVDCRGSASINAPHRIWQAAVFYHFIFQKPTIQTKLYLPEVTVWVRNWFGEAEVSNGLGNTNLIPGELLKAVKGFLFYLEGCGFIAYAGPGTGGEFVVKHSELRPPGGRAAEYLDHRYK
ncbi:MAG: hypothetical protein ACXWC4_00745 [Telluria sp.]